MCFSGRREVEIIEKLTNLLTRMLDRFGERDMVCESPEENGVERE